MATAKKARKKAPPAEEPQNQDMYVDLHRSGLDEEDAELMQLYYCTEAPEGIDPPGAGYVIPYFDVDGDATGFMRYRYLVDTRSGFEKLSGAKQRRYTQPADTVPQVYWPPHMNWRNHAENPETIIITEGEKKAARATKAGIPTIGLGGVWSFQNAPRNEPLLPDLDFINWEGRKTYIIYDSDAADKIQIQQAEYRLARRLVRAGAQVYIVRIPAAVDGAKQGLDDYIQNEGAESLMDMMDRAEQFTDSAALHALNAEVAYVKDPGIIYVIETGQQVAAEAFRSHRFADRTYTRVTLTEKGSKLEERSAAADWIKWPYRNAVEKLAFEPGQPAVTTDGSLNLWRGWKYSPLKGDIQPWKELLDHLFKGQPESRLWAEQWCAYPFQYPGAKHRTALCVWGRKTGTGKSLIGYTLGDLYGDAFAEIGDEQIEKKDFNSWANNKQFILGDDITGNSNRQVANLLKIMISREKLLINIKHIPEYYIRDVLNYYFTSNSPDAFLLDEDDRRMYIHEVTSAPLDDAFYTEYFDKWRKSERGRRALMHYLMNEVDCTGFNHTSRAPLTDAKREMISLTRTDLEGWLIAVREDPDPFCRRFGDSDLLTIPELMAAYDPERNHRVTAATFARKLKEVGIERADPGDRPPGAQIRVAPHGELVRLYAVRNYEKWNGAPGEKMREYYETKRRLKPAPASRARKF